MVRNKSFNRDNLRLTVILKRPEGCEDGRITVPLTERNLELLNGLIEEHDRVQAEYIKGLSERAARDRAPNNFSAILNQKLKGTWYYSERLRWRTREPSDVYIQRVVRPKPMRERGKSESVMVFFYIGHTGAPGEIVLGPPGKENLDLIPARFHKEEI